MRELQEFRGESESQLADKDLQRRVRVWSIQSTIFGSDSVHLDIDYVMYRETSSKKLVEDWLDTINTSDDDDEIALSEKQPQENPGTRVDPVRPAHPQGQEQVEGTMMPPQLTSHRRIPSDYVDSFNTSNLPSYTRSFSSSPPRAIFTLEQRELKHQRDLARRESREFDTSGSFAAQSPNLGHHHSFDLDMQHSPMLPSQQTTLYREHHQIEIFSLSDPQPQLSVGNQPPSPGYDPPSISPRLGPQQSQTVLGLLPLQNWLG
jgi:hypothetical protein